MEGIQNIINIIKNKEVTELIITAMIFAFFLLGSSIFSKLICKIFKVRKVKLKDNAIYKNLKVIFIVLGIYLSILFLQLPFGFMSIFNKIARITLIILITKFVADLIAPKVSLLKRFVKDEQKGQTSYKFLTKLLKGLIYVIGAFIIISELGYNISGIITGLGLSGVVLALAAQDIAKNLFAGFAVLTDKTFVVGDYIEIDNVAGTIEDISFRTTRIRTLNNAIVTLPNSILSDGKVTNWNKVLKRRYEFNLKFKLNSNVTVLKEISNRIKFVLKTNKDIIPDSINVNFSEILEDGINLNIYFYTPIVDYVKFIEFKSEINMMILSMLEKEGIELAYPTSNVIVGR